MVLILDVSGSMGKNDLPGGETRLAAMQAPVARFVAARKQDRIGLVIFSSSAYPFAPLSEDKQALQARITQLSSGMIGEHNIRAEFFQADRTAVSGSLFAARWLNPNASSLAGYNIYN